VLTNIQNHVDTVGWQNIEALELVRGKLDKLMAGGLRIEELGYAYVKP
jgi:hypothetical protein